MSVPDNQGPSGQDVDYVAHVLIMPILLSIGLVNQCLNVMTLSRLPSVGFLYLRAAAIADIASIFALIPFVVRHAGWHAAHDRRFMLFHAHAELPIINAFITANTLCIVAMTVDRYLSICHPVKFFTTGVDSRPRTRAIVVMLYITAFAIFLPSAWQKTLIQHRETGEWHVVRNEELMHSKAFQVYLLFRELLARLVPIVLLVVLNGAMLRSLRRLGRRIARRRSMRHPAAIACGGLQNVPGCTPPNRRGSDRQRISVLLLITSATFVVCTLPASLLSLLIGHSHQYSMPLQVFRAIANLLQVTSYLYNFYFYALCSSEYRHAFLRLIGRTGERRLSEESPTARLSTNAHGGANNHHRCRRQVLAGGAPRFRIDAAVPAAHAEENEDQRHLIETAKMQITAAKINEHEEALLEMPVVNAS